MRICGRKQKSFLRRKVERSFPGCLCFANTRKNSKSWKSRPRSDLRQHLVSSTLRTGFYLALVFYSLQRLCSAKTLNLFFHFHWLHSLLTFFLTVAAAFPVIGSILGEEKTQGPTLLTTLWSTWKGVPVKKIVGQMKYFIKLFQYMLGQLSISENTKAWTNRRINLLLFFFQTTGFYSKSFFWPDSLRIIILFIEV